MRFDWLLDCPLPIDLIHLVSFHIVLHTILDNFLEGGNQADSIFHLAGEGEAGSDQSRNIGSNSLVHFISDLLVLLLGDSLQFSHHFVGAEGASPHSNSEVIGKDFGNQLALEPLDVKGNHSCQIFLPDVDLEPRDFGHLI